MITCELLGDTAIFTVLDKNAQIEDLEISADDGSDKVFVRQQWENADKANVIVLSPNQAAATVKILTALLVGTELEYF